MLGDLNGSCDDCIHGDGNGNGPIPIVIQETEETFVVKSPVDGIVHGLTLALDLNGEIPYDITSTLPGAEFAIRDGSVVLTWMDYSSGHEGLQLSSSTDILTIHTAKPSSISMSPKENYVVSVNTGINSLYPVGSRNNTHSHRYLTISDNTTIDISDMQGNISVNLYDLQGRSLLSQQNDSTISHMSIDLENIPTGVYIIRIEDGVHVRAKRIFVSR